MLQKLLDTEVQRRAVHNFCKKCFETGQTMKSIKLMSLSICGVLAIAAVAVADRVVRCECEGTSSLFWGRSKKCDFYCEPDTAAEKSDSKAAYKQWIDYILGNETEKADGMLKPWSEQKYFGDGDAIQCGAKHKSISKTDVSAVSFRNCSMARILFPLFDSFPIRTLNISHMRLDRLEPSTFERAPELETLTASHNNLKTIPYYLFWGAEQLKYVDFSFNDIRTVPVQSFAGAKAVVSVDLAKNRIDRVQPDLFEMFGSLRTLNLSRNHLRSIEPATFAGATELRTLDLSYNYIGALDANAFANLTKLERLNLCSNDLGILPVGIFASLTQLQHLDLSFTHLHELQLGTFSYNPNLRSLNVSYNWLKRFDFGLFLPEHAKLTELRLDANQLTNVDGLSHRLVKNLKTLGITNNLFSCSYLGYFFEQVYWKGLTVRIEPTEVDRNATNINGIQCIADDEYEQNELVNDAVDPMIAQPSTDYQRSEVFATENNVNSLYYRNAAGEVLLIKSTHQKDFLTTDFSSGIAQVTEFIILALDDDETHTTAYVAIGILVLVAIAAYFACCRRGRSAKSESVGTGATKKSADEKDPNKPISIQM